MRVLAAKLQCAARDTSFFRAAGLAVINTWEDAYGQRHPIRAENRNTEVRASVPRAIPIS